ncbi:MAG: diguanylate cyclase [Lachnospiraceae bacterium]|nr:diguanylate cyclase [Lachnospiraceae bacterium]
MAKEKKRRSLIFSIMRMSVIPILILGIVLTVYSQNSVREGMSFEVEKKLAGIAHNLISVYNMIDGGEFYEEDGKLMKGETELTSDYRILDDIKSDTGVDVTIFFGKERRLTTLMDNGGNRMTGTVAADKVVEIVLGDGEEYFSENVDVNGEDYFGYYVPIRNDKNEVVGISFAGAPVESVRDSMQYMVQGNILICIFVILLAGAICHILSRRMVEAIQHIKNFLAGLAKGNFSQKMSRGVLERRDELADIGEYVEDVSQSLSDLVSKDPLTDLLNRRAFLQEVKGRKNPENIVVAMCDIDYFKKVNDSYGHEKGDEVLKCVADVLKDTVSETGFVSRWGGEEFLIGFDGSVEELKDRLEKAREAILGKQFECGGDSFHISITAGVTCGRHGETFDHTICRADDLLYEGKEKGRNQIVSEE